MIRMIHISDFHLENSVLNDWENYTKKALIETINSQQPKCPVSDTFVICSGDMINKAGVGYGGVLKTLQRFNEKVIQPVLDGTGLPLDHFILVPGNHEVDRKADERCRRHPPSEHCRHAGQRDRFRILICPQAVHSVPVGAAGHYSRAPQKAGAHQGEHHYQKDTL